MQIQIHYNIKILILALILTFNYSFVANVDATGETNYKSTKSFSKLLKSSDPWVDSVYNSLSLDERIAQLFMVKAYSNKGNKWSAHARETMELVKKYKVGGLIFFQGGPGRQAVLTNYYQNAAQVPLMIAIDGEWGLGMRLDSTISYPRQMMLGAIQDEELIYEMGVEIGHQCRRIGINVNFAPVVDINNNPLNPVINNRSFGESKYNVARKGIQYMLGLQNQGVLTTAKHFPGHGDTETDSHKDLPILKHSRKRLDTLELYPFRQMIANGVTGIMVGHLHIPSLDDRDNSASTISPKIATLLLKKQLKFRGLVFTDALNMQGVSKFTEPGELEVKALLAGNDVLLYPTDVPLAIEKIKLAIAKGEIKTSVINDRCRRILTAKKWLGLDTLTPVKVDSINEDINSEYANNLNRRLIENSLTVIQNNDNILPLKHLEQRNIACVVVGDTEINTFQQRVGNYAQVDNFNIAKDASSHEFDSLLKSLQKYNTVITAIVNTHQKPGTNFGITDSTISFLEKLVLQNHTILSHFANAYSVASLKSSEQFKSILLAYQDTPEIQDLAAQLIFGAIPAKGKLPVSINDRYRVGDGVLWDGSIRLKYADPYYVGMNAEMLHHNIDSIAQKAVAEGATPGCQILVARNNAVIFHKAYGHHTYAKQTKLEITDIYDLASITKIAASTTSLMQMYDQGKFQLDTILSAYLPELDTTNKGNLWIKDILTHQARFKSWIPFYLSIIKDYDNPEEKIISRWYSQMYPVKLGKACYLRNDYSFRDSILSNMQTDTFSIQVAKDLYINKFWRDTIFQKIRESDLEVKKEYKYSDLGFYYFRLVIERLSGLAFEDYTHSAIYAPLGAKTMGFLPLQRFDTMTIVPTEDDRIFRKQLLRGFVHDPGAAMLGGVSGHAGLFSDANDLAKLMQMFLNKGQYGGQQFIQPSTVDLFTSCPFCDEGNRRGYGFDKPNPDTSAVSSVAKSCSLLSFGHSGFTGTITWVDPKEDLIYIFLSNRICPETDNSKIYELDVRPSIHESIYKAIKK